MNHVLVTGAGRGIGLETVKQLLKRGDSVIATYRCRHIITLADALSIDKTGTFFTWEGKIHEW
ncbi:SDR family NAD(P)-dependent oxidoreductase [Enterovibrio nigricans]|uniref:Short chain dehydrogenase n=1 Tax=Enterovibrio nigricans DSM 22720 TaxID=1121868 RepID=A0A1T4VG22_9GAMM|nr:SDR family NAD(P)-dependent oxidoreductase [Enterovibrio nigricans]PKF49754.1 hypothetical protein AT251_16625 [Enterovibrio nigricans]SKA63925.1 short chain dehydrogenase [Enterovibrio nigricans DSM 22720]